MSAYEPGTVAVATVRGVDGIRVFCTTNTTRGYVEWALGERVPRFDEDSYGSGFAKPEEVTNVRPLVVLDVDYLPEAAADLVALLRSNYFTSAADQIEAQTKPPRIPEPGLWGVVDAYVPGIPTRRWVHHEEGRWVSDMGIPVKQWDELIDPVLIREGVES